MLLILGLSSGCDCGQCPTVETLFCSEDNTIFIPVLFACVLPEEFDRCFVCFGAGVAEENFIGDRIFHQNLRQLPLLRNIEEIRNVMKFTHLLRDSSVQNRTCVTQGTRRDSRHEVEVLLASVIIQQTTFALGDGHIIPPISIHHILLRISFSLRNRSHRRGINRRDHSNCRAFLQHTPVPLQFNSTRTSNKPQSLHRHQPPTKTRPS
mmetsp:Transcript_37993/g.150983  ORF Transcript_37993/g.150983 Transcript_37993/m.150983 type:complete len:208 (+) Transcript_37993:1892-2515(+)